MPKEPDVNVITDNKSGELMYVSRTMNLRRRLFDNHHRGGIKNSQSRKKLSQHYDLEENEDKINICVDDNCAFQFIKKPKIGDRIVLEHFAVAVLRPILNLLLKH
nr:hypothetical protein [Candidatus Njordarchaeota archaeon]